MCLLFIQTIIFCSRHQWLIHLPFSIFKNPRFSHFSALFLPWEFQVRQNKGKGCASVLQGTPRQTNTGKHNYLGISSTLLLEPGMHRVGRQEWGRYRLPSLRLASHQEAEWGKANLNATAKLFYHICPLFWIQHSLHYCNTLIIFQSSDSLLWVFAQFVGVSVEAQAVGAPWGSHVCWAKMGILHTI